MKKAGILLLMGFVLIAISRTPASAQARKNKPRTIVTTDGEVDDIDSFIRMLLYANEFDLVGLVYSSSQWHYSGDGKGTRFTSEMPNTAKRYGQRTDLRWPGTTWMQEYIGKYGQVYQNLTKHSKEYPAPEYLLRKVKVGNITFEGEMEKDTEGSDLIKAVLLDANPNPVYLQIWGGTNTVAQALKSIAEQYKNTAQWPAIYQQVSNKAIIYTVLDQDATYSKYIAPNWPQIKVLYNSDQFWSFAYAWPRVVPAALQPYLGGKWFAENIKFNHGPLLASYYLWGDGQKLAGDPEHTMGKMENATKNNREQYDFISEGDSPAYFYLLDVGLRSLENISYGGWGGRMVPSSTNPFRWEDGKGVTDYNGYTKQKDTAFPQTRWVDVLQNDFAARADWCVKSYQEANHAPLVKLKQKADLKVNPGLEMILSGSATDPDKDQVQFRWWHYPEAGTYKGVVALLDSDQPKVSFQVPPDAPIGSTIHLILEVSDAGTPSLTRYQRTILTVE